MSGDPDDRNAEWTLDTNSYGPRPLKSTGRHGHFLNSTCDIGLSDMRQGLDILMTWDIAFS